MESGQEKSPFESCHGRFHSGEEKIQQEHSHLPVTQEFSLNQRQSDSLKEAHVLSSDSSLLHFHQICEGEVIFYPMPFFESSLVILKD